MQDYPPALSLQETIYIHLGGERQCMSSIDQEDIKKYFLYILEN